MIEYTGILAWGLLALIALVICSIFWHWLIFPVCVLGGVLAWPVARWYAEMFTQ